MKKLKVLLYPYRDLLENFAYGVAYTSLFLCLCALSISAWLQIFG